VARVKQSAQDSAERLDAAGVSPGPFWLDTSIVGFRIILELCGQPLQGSSLDRSLASAGLVQRQESRLFRILQKLSEDAPERLEVLRIFVKNSVDNPAVDIEIVVH